jgi:branched-chain amino acid transport system substrate-binding protein
MAQRGGAAVARADRGGDAVPAVRAARASSGSRARPRRAAPTAAASTSVFGTPKKATGTPYVFGMINDETGAVTFPEARQGAIAAVDYVNNYLDGINGHPIVIDRVHRRRHAGHRGAVRQPAGGRSPARDPRRGRRRRARLDPDLRARQPGLPGRHPVHPGARDRVELHPVLVGQRRRQRGGRRVRGQDAGRQERRARLLQQRPGRVDPAPDHAGVQGGRGDDDQDIPLSPTSPDPSPQAALVESSGAQLVYVDIPNGCGNVLKALKSVGYTGKIMGIDPCSAPPVIAAAAGGAEGMYIASPFMLQSGSSRRRSCSRRR